MSSAGVRRLAGRAGVVFVVAAAWQARDSAAAWAHESVDEVVLTGGPPAWVDQAGGWAAATVMMVVAAVSTRQLLRPGTGPVVRYWAPLAQLLAAWLLLGFVQSATARAAGTPAPLLLAGLVLLPVVIVAVWVFVVANAGALLRVVLARWRYRWLALGVALVFAAFYLWAGNLVAPPEPADLPSPGSSAFVMTSSAYGPLAMWPVVEFWIPELSVFGAVSLGAGLVVATLAALMGLAWASVVHTARSRRRDRRGQGTRMGAVTGAGSVGAVNFCCCCAPAAYPLLAAVLGPSAASSVAAWMVGSSSPLYNLGQVAMIALVLWMLTSMAIRTRPTGPGHPPAGDPTVHTGSAVRAALDTAE
jgi:hypothetical protein